MIMREAIGVGWDKWQYQVKGGQAEHVCHVPSSRCHLQAVAIAHRAMPGRDQGAKPCRVNERQLFEVQQDSGGMGCLGLLQGTLQAGALA
jgi:hypothetical protein